MIEIISKPKIPKQYGFVLKTEQLRVALEENNINTHTDLNYCFYQQIGSIFEVFFWPPNENIPYNRLYIRAGALPREKIFLAREKLKSIVLPEFVSWVKEIINLPINSPYQGVQFRFEASFIDNAVEIIKHRC
ncbi:MAG: hypothetical protein FWE85_05540 [Clostridiales bacterium]|nr:hypothetical protein [Clostridiales bacterium]